MLTLEMKVKVIHFRTSDEPGSLHIYNVFRDSKLNCRWVTALMVIWRSMFLALKSKDKAVLQKVQRCVQIWTYCQILRF